MKRLACYSIKGGVGKTAGAVNLAYALSEAGGPTLLLDLDPQGASTFYFRMRPSRGLKAKKLLTDTERLLSAIRGSDYENLDVLPANLSFRNLDVLLKSLKGSRRRLSHSLDLIDGEYENAVLDCPPNITLLSENVLTAADVVLVPVIPTTLSERTYRKLLDFCHEHRIPTAKVYPFFSMVQTNNRMHRETMERLRAEDPKFLNTSIPFTVEVERMGIHREPVLATQPRGRAARAYRELAVEVLWLLEGSGRGD